MKRFYFVLLLRAHQKVAYMWKIVAQQQGDTCTSRVVRVHNSCCASAHQLLGDDESNVFGRHHLTFQNTFIKFSKNFNYFYHREISKRYQNAQIKATAMLLVISC